MPSWMGFDELDGIIGFAMAAFEFTLYVV